MQGAFIPFESYPKPPAWVTHVGGILNKSIDELRLDGQSPAGLIYIRIDSFLFVITFGHAWQKLKQDWLVPDFGRKIVLNSISTKS